MIYTIAQIGMGIKNNDAEFLQNFWNIISELPKLKVLDLRTDPHRLYDITLINFSDSVRELLISKGIKIIKN